MDEEKSWRKRMQNIAFALPEDDKQVLLAYLLGWVSCTEQARVGVERILGIENDGEVRDITER